MENPLELDRVLILADISQQCGMRVGFQSGLGTRIRSAHLMDQDKDFPQALKTVSFQPVEAFLGTIKGESKGESC
jgi:hypothetical protein